MGIADWFNFETAKQKKKKMDRYYKKLYPFGEEQKSWEENRLNEVFPNNKKTKSYHFELLILRESIANFLFFCAGEYGFLVFAVFDFFTQARGID